MKKFLSALVLLALVSTQAHAENVFMGVTGKVQGPFKGESPIAARKERMPLVAFNFEVLAPRDLNTGLPVGKRQHKPIVVTKEWGAASPQFVQALISNEVLTQVVIEFYDTATNGEEVISSTMKLTNASVTDVNQTFSETAGKMANLQNISFTYQKMELTDKSGTTVIDDGNN